MGRWLYVNAMLLLASVVFMYLHFATYYQPAWHVYVLATLLWLMVYALGHYLFIYKMRSEKKGRQTSSAGRSHSVQAAAKSERPNVILKKERPQVDLKKKKDTNHGE